MKLKKSAIACFLLSGAVSLASAGDGAAPSRNIDGIRDNSFLIEEAYNQEPGVVQHILNVIYGTDDQPGTDDHFWQIVFTQEWPLFSQTHQLSYTLPYDFVETGGQSSDGIGDVLLNYRYEVFFHEESLTAFSPRFSLILPTGDADKGFGEDTLGYQINLPFSTTVGDNWFIHLNAGFTYLPDAASAGDRDLKNYNLGASTIYAATPNFNLLVEWIGTWEEELVLSGNLDPEFSSVIMPGFRKAFNFSNGSQLVAGLGIPIGLTDSAPDIGAFLYLSFEHAFRRLDQSESR